MKKAVEHTFQKVAACGWNFGREIRARAMWNDQAAHGGFIVSPVLGARPIAKLRRRNWSRWPTRFRIAVRGILPNALWRPWEVFRYGIAHGFASATQPLRFVPATF